MLAPSPTLRRAQRVLRDELVLRIDPATVSIQVVGKLPLVRSAQERLDGLPLPLPEPVVSVGLRLVTATHPFVLSPQRYPATRPLDEVPKVARLADLVAHRDHPTASRWWRDHATDVAAGRTLRLGGTVITDEAGLRAHLDEYLLPMIDSLERDGYREDLAGEHGLVHVGPDGRLHKANKGNHRFALARVLGIQRVPVRVLCVHETWWRAVATGRTTGARLAGAREALRGVAAAHSR